MRMLDFVSTPADSKIRAFQRQTANGRFCLHPMQTRKYELASRSSELLILSQRPQIDESMTNIEHIRFTQFLGGTARTLLKPFVFKGFWKQCSKKRVFFLCFESDPGRAGSDLTPLALYQIRQNPYRCKHCLGNDIPNAAKLSITSTLTN